MTNEQTVIAFLRALENRTSANDIKDFYHPEVEQIEFPNTLTKTMATRDLHGLLEGLERGMKVLQKERYEVQKTYSLENTVIAEVIWEGTLAIPIGNKQPGETMVAYFAQFYEFKEGKIYRQRNYDCFVPFA